MLRIGLTGGIACGKSHVLRRLAQAGIPTLDLDVLAHDVLAPGTTASSEVRARFGPGVVDAEGAIDRRVLARRVFGDAESRRLLNSIVHPRIRAEEERRTRRAADGGAALLVTDGALLIEAGGHLRFDRLVVAHCDEQRQIERLCDRDGLSHDEAHRRVAAQMPMEEKRRFASFGIDTNGRPEATDAQCEGLARELWVLARTERRAAALTLRQVVGCVEHGPRSGPRGLAPVTVLAAWCAGAPNLGALAEAIEASRPAAWYEMADEPNGGEAGEAARLSAAVVLGALARRGLDRTAAIAAAAAVARLTHRAPEAIAGACLMADACAELAGPGELGPSWRGKLAAWKVEATKWGGAAAPTGVLAALDAAARHPADVSAARGASARTGGDAELAGALVGLSAGALSLDAAPSGLLEACRQLGLH